MAKSPPAKRKSDGLVMRFPASSSKRSERGRNISWSSSGAKLSDGRSSSSSSMATKEVGESEKQKLSAKDKKLGDPKSYTEWLRGERKKAKPTGNASVGTSDGCLKRKKSIAVLEGSVASERKCGTKPLEGKHPQLRFCSGLSQGKRRREQCADELSKTPEVQSDDVVKKQRTAFDMKDHTLHLEAGSKGKKVDGCKEGTSVTPADTVANSSARSTACVYTKSNDKCASTTHNVDRNIIVTPEVHMVEGEERRKLLDAQKIRHFRLKPGISKLCEILQLCDAVKVMVQSLLEYVMINHQVNIEAATTLQAFQISLCWTVSSFLKQKISHKKSLSLAKERLNFSCTREETDYFCAMLRCLKHTFLFHTKAESLKSGELSSKDALKDHAPKASQSAAPNLQKVGSKVEDVSVYLEDLAEKDIDRGIKEIRKKFKKKMKKVIDKLEKEKSGVLRAYEVGKERLERQKETESAVSQSCFQEHMLARSDKVKMLEKEIGEHELHKVTLIENLEGLQREANKKLEEQENKWVNEVRSWAHAELLNRSTTNGPGRVPSCEEWTQNTDTMHISDVEVRLVVPETVSSMDCLEQPPSLNLSTAQQNPQGDACRVLDEEVPLGFSSSHTGNKVVSVSPHSCEEKVSVLSVTTVKGVESRVSENLNEGQGNLPYVGPPSDEPTPEKAREWGTVSSSHCSHKVVSASTPTSEKLIKAVRVPMQNRNVESGMFQTVNSSDGLENRAFICLSASKKSILEKFTELELVSSSHGLHILESVRSPSSKENNSEKSTEHESVRSSHGLHNLESVRPTSSEEQIHESTLIMPAKEVELGVPGTLNLNEGLVKVVSVTPPPSEEQIPEKATEHEAISSSHGLHNFEYMSPLPLEEQINLATVTMAPKEVESGVSETVNSNDGLPNHVSVDQPSSEEQIPDSAAEHETICLHQIHIRRVTMPDKGVESEVHEAVSSKDELANLASVYPPSSEQQHLGKATEKEKSNSDTETGICQKYGFKTSGNGNTDGENPLVRTVHPSTALVHGLSVTLDQADQGKGTLLSTVPAMQSGDVQACYMQDTSELVEHSVATAPNNHSDLDVPYNEAAVQVQLVQSSTTSGHNRLESTSAGGIGIQPSSEHHTFNQVAHAPVQIAENLPLSNQPVFQPVDVSTGGSGLFFPETRAANVSYAFNYHPIHHPAPYGASVMSYPRHPDPLQSELENLNKEKEQRHKSHEDMKQRLQSDCDKEIKEAVAEIHRKYEIRFQETDTEFHLKEKELDALHNKVLMNHVLAWSFSKYMDSIRGSSALGVQQDRSFFVQQLNQQSMQQNAIRHSPVGSSSLASPPAPSLPMSLAPLPNLQATSLAPPTSSHSTAPSMHTISLSTALRPRIPARPPQISSFSPGLAQGGGEIRAPAPHLLAFRPSASVPNWPSYNNSPTTFPSLNIPRNPGPAQQHIPFSRARSESREAVPSLTTASMPNSESYSNSPATLPSLHIPGQPAPTQQYVPFSRARSESTAVPALRCNASALELVLNSGSGTSPPGSLPSRPNVGLNLDQFHLSGPAVPVGPCVNPVHMSGSTGVVCLSDDD